MTSARTTSGCRAAVRNTVHRHAASATRQWIIEFVSRAIFDRHVGLLRTRRSGIPRIRDEYRGSERFPCATVADGGILRVPRGRSPRTGEAPPPLIESKPALASVGNASGRVRPDSYGEDRGDQSRRRPAG